LRCRALTQKTLLKNLKYKPNKMFFGYHITCVSDTLRMYMGFIRKIKWRKPEVKFRIPIVLLALRWLPTLPSCSWP